MSDFAEQVYSLLTDDWQTSRDLAERIGGRDLEVLAYKVRRVLHTYSRYGLVEVSYTEGNGCNKRYYWRLAQ